MWTVLEGFTVIETTAEVVDIALEMPAGSPTTELLPESGTETTTPLTVGDARLSSLPSLKRVNTAEHFRAAEGAMEASGVGSQGTAPQSQDPSLGRTITGPKLGLFFRRGDVEVALGYRDYLRGLEEFKAEPLKERRRHLKNNFFRVRNLTFFFWVICLSAA